MNRQFLTLSVVATLLVSCRGEAASLQRGEETTKTPTVRVDVPPPGDTQELHLKDGSRLFGRVEAADDTRIVFRTVAGVTLEIDRTQIARLRVVRGRVVRGEFYPADANTTRLFFAPTGRSLRRGEGYIGVYEIGLPFVQVGLTDRISVGGGTPLFFGGGGDRPFWVTPKVQLFDGQRVKAALGVIHIFGAERDGGLGIAYSVMTVGNGDAAATVGVGYGYRQAGQATDATPILMVGGEGRQARRVKVITENYLWPGGGLLSGGVRFLGEQLSADLGLVIPLGGEGLFAVPIVNFVWRF